LKRILLLDQTLDARSLVASYAIGLARREGARLSVVCLVNPESERTYWLAIQELLEDELKEKVSQRAKALVEACKKAGVQAEVLVGGGHPVEAVLELARKAKAEMGSAHLNAQDIASLSAELTCPVLTAEAIRERYRPYPKKEALAFLAFSGAMAALYLVFFRTYDWVKLFTLSGTALAAVAILVFVPLVAFLGGSAAENLLKAFKFEAKH
jgi:hypothetical protein